MQDGKCVCMKGYQGEFCQQGMMMMMMIMVKYDHADDEKSGFFI